MQANSWPKSLVLILILFGILATWYAAVTPFRQAGILLGQRDPQTRRPLQVPDIGAPDERQHVNYVAQILQGKLPRLVPGDFENYQAHQPPLYYLMGAAVATITRQTADPMQLKWPLRGLNIALGLLTLVGVFRLAQLVLDSEPLALAATALVGFMPMFLALHGAASNDPLLFCWMTWALVSLFRALKTGWTASLCIGLGILLGLSVLTKTSGLALWATVGAGVFWSLRRPQNDGKPFVLKTLVQVLGLALLIASPWWLRNVQLYGDPLAMRAFNEAFAGSPQASFFIQQMGASTYWVEMVGWWTARSWVGVFSYMDIFIRPELYVACWLVLLVITLGGVFRLQDLPSESRPLLGLCLFHALVVLVLFIQFNSQYFQGQARYLYPAIGATSVVAAAGLSKLGQTVEQRGWIVLATLMVLGNVYLLASFLPAQFDLRTVGASFGGPG